MFGLKLASVVPVPKGDASCGSLSEHSSSFPLACNQWGFLPGCSTDAALLTVVHTWHKFLESGS